MTSKPRSEFPALARHVTLHLIEGQGLILDKRSQTVLAATGPDALLLCCLAEGMTRDNALDKLSQHLDLTREDAGRRITMALSVWHEAGLFDDDDGSGEALLHGSDEAVYRLVTDHDAVPDKDEDGTDGRIRLLDTDFTIAFADGDARESCEDVLRRLAPDRPAADRVRLNIVRNDTDYVLRSGTQTLAVCDAPKQIPLMLLSVCGQIAAYRSDAVLAVHAGVVRLDAGCALLVGPAGTGKSTLVAGLATRGFDALCDDTALLAGDALEVRPLRTGVWIKRGSWPILRPRFVDHRDGGERLRPDGQYVRRLPIQSAFSAEPGGDRLAACRIVFPCFDPSAQPALDALDSPAAFKSLVEHVYLLGHGLDPGTLERLIDWISGIPCFRIRYPSLEVAIDQFRSIAR